MRAARPRPLGAGMDPAFIDRDVAAPAEKMSLKGRAAEAIAVCNEYLPEGMKPVTMEMESINKVYIDANDAVDLFYTETETTSTLKIESFFFYMESDERQELKRSVESADGDSKRTLAGMAMEWIKHLALALGAAKIELNDTWFGSTAQKDVIMSGDLEFHPDARDFKARKHAWDKSDAVAVQRLSDRLNGGYYAMWGFEYAKPPLRRGDARDTVPAEVTPLALEVLRQPFVDVGLRARGAARGAAGGVQRVRVTSTGAVFANSAFVDACV